VFCISAFSICEDDSEKRVSNKKRRRKEAEERRTSSSIFSQASFHSLTFSLVPFPAGFGGFDASSSFRWLVSS
jgi:hypothetical protein